jgi:hypothetical protein
VCGANVRAALLRLWLHEHLRVYCDRLVSADDGAWMRGQLLEVMRARFDCWQGHDDVFGPDKEVVFGEVDDLPAGLFLVRCSLCCCCHKRNAILALDARAVTPGHAPSFSNAATVVTSTPLQPHPPKGDFLRPGVPLDQRAYEELPADPARLARLLESYQVGWLDA